MPSLRDLYTVNSTYGMMGGIPTDFKETPHGAYIPKRSMVIKNKRRRAHLARTRRR